MCLYICLICFYCCYCVFVLPGKYFTCLLAASGLVQPRALIFSEVNPRSFRASWEIDAVNVKSYLVRFKPAEDLYGHFVSLPVAGDTLTTVLPHLTPLTRYEVHIYAQFDKGDSLPVTGYETTLEGRHKTPHQH